jgi:putative ABC transport system permease protein
MFRRRREMRDFNAEIEAHLQLEIDRLREQGLTEEAARTAARRAFGNVTKTQERFYESGHWVGWDHLLQDVRFGLRMLRKSPGFSLVAVLTLALAVGANTAIFSAVYAVLLKPLPFKDPGRLVFLEKKNPSRGWERNPISPAEFLAWRDQSGAFEDGAAYTQNHCVLTGGAEAEEDPCETISSNLFSLLGVTPLLGRTFSAQEDKAGEHVAILSYALWQRRFGGEESVIGRAIDIGGESYTIVGVMPANFSHSYAPPYHAISESGSALWLSGIALSPTNVWNDYFGVGRLKAAGTMQQASMLMDTVSARMEPQYPELKGWRAQLMTLRTMRSGDTRPALLVLMGAVVFVLLIACANIANLLLARGAGRANEFAVRNALGATRVRIIRQLLTESLVLSLAGGALGVLLAVAITKGLVGLAPAFLLKSAPELGSGALDLRVLSFALGTVVLTTLFFGLAPAVQSARPELTQTLSETGRSSLQSLRSRRFRSALVVSEIALAMILLTGAGLMLRTFAQLSHVNLGFNPSNLLTMRVLLTGAQYKEPQSRVQFWESVATAVKSLPGVESASVSRGLPIGWSGQFFVTGEQPNPPAGQVPGANYVIAGPDYFRVLQIPLRSGRVFNDHDTHNADNVVIVNEELARVYWPGQDPLGKQLRVGPPSAPWRSIVGVAENVLSRGPDEGYHPELYIPYQQYPWLLDGPRNLLLRTFPGVKPESLVHSVVQEIHRLDKDQPVADIATMEQVAGQLIAQQRMVMALLTSFAVLALFLSALGIYSVLSYSVAQRTREIGLRVALGAQRGSVLLLVVGAGAALVSCGIAAGIAAAMGLTRLMTDLLYGVRPTDALTFGTVTVLLAATSLLACYIPARRAMAVDPMIALRHE